MRKRLLILAVIELIIVLGVVGLGAAVYAAGLDSRFLLGVIFGGIVLFAAPLVLGLAILPMLANRRRERIQRTGQEALAEVLEDGRALANAFMQNANYNGPEPVLELSVRVKPENTAPFDAKMKFGLSEYFLLTPCVEVLVRYEPANKTEVYLADTPQAILARNPSLKRED